MTQQRLPGIRTAPHAVAITAQWSHRAGWNLRVSWRASAQPVWTTRDYDSLTSDELVDVVLAELEQLAGGRELPATGGGAGAE